MVEQSVLDAVRQYLDVLAGKGLRISFGVVFGSHATGRADTWSDIDLLVVSPDFDTPLSHEGVNDLWRQAARTDSRIEPIPCGLMEWEHDDSRAIVEIARREGVRVRSQEAMAT